MVARLCYEEARNKDNLTDCVNTNKERAGIAGEAERYMYTKTAEGVVSGSEKIAFRKPTRILSLVVF